MVIPNAQLNQGKICKMSSLHQDSDIVFSFALLDAKQLSTQCPMIMKYEDSACMNKIQI